MILLFLFLQIEEKFLFASDKIYTVLVVVLIIWAGITWKLFSLDKKVKEIEEKQKKQS